MADREKKLVDRLFEVYGTLKNRRTSWEQSWQELSDLVSPRRGSFSWDSENQKGYQHSSNIFDATAITAARVMADGLLGYCAPQNTNWFAFRFANEQLNQVDAAVQWLDDCQKVFMTLLDRSGFYDSFAEMANDAVTIGTATTWITPDPKEKKLIFKVRHPKEIYLDENRFGEVDVVVRRYKLSGREAIEAFGEKAFDEKFLKQIEDDPLKEYFFLHAVYPRKSRIAGKIDKKNKKYASLHILEDERKLLREDGYDSFPYICYRMKTNANEVYGRSPAWDVKSVILRVNQMHRAMLINAQYAAQPVKMVPSESLSEFKRRWKPDGMVPYVDPNRIALNVQNGGSFPVTREAIAIDQAEIQSAFMTDVFLMLSAEDSRARTATEANLIQSEKTAVLGSLVSRLLSEYMNSTFDRCWSICQAQNWLPPVPQEMAMYGSGEIKADFVGPLPAAMKRYFSTRSVMEALSNYVPLIEMFPSMKHLLNPIELGRFLLQSGGMPEIVIRDRPEINKILAAEAQAMQKQMELQDMGAQADMISKTGAKPEEGSPADGYMKAVGAQTRKAAQKQRGAA